jgi:hypothetical protein
VPAIIFDTANTLCFSYFYGGINFKAALAIRPTAVPDGVESFKGSHGMGDFRIFLKISVPLALINTYQMNIISAGSISLESTFKTLNTIFPNQGCGSGSGFVLLLKTILHSLIFEIR